MVGRPWKLGLGLLWLWSLASGCHLVAGISEGRPQCQADDDINGLETDTDCGGPCAPCQNGQRCDVDGDCASGVCDEATCVAATCFDGRLNGDEGGLDCGGTMMGCRRCLAGELCRQPEDCASFAFYMDDESPVPACYREEPGSAFGFCLPSCCSNDCLGCIDLCELKGCCNDPSTCCEGICSAPGSGVLLYGQECGPNLPICFPPLQCLPDETNRLRCR